MNKLKEEQGITLVALIITIVVLLILAIVSIGAVKDSGIIGHAQNAATDYNAKQKEEEGLLAQYETLLDEQMGIGPWKVQEDGTIKNGKTEETKKIGDTFTNDEVLAATGGTKSSYTGTWTILGVENGRLKLVSTTDVASSVKLGNEDPEVYVKDEDGNPTTTLRPEIVEIFNKAGEETNLELEKAIWSYQHAVETLNGHAKAATGITSAESIDIQDIYDIIGEENVNRGEKYKWLTNYYYKDEKIYIRMKEKESDPWPTNNSYMFVASNIFLNKKGEIVILDSTDNGEGVTLENTYYSYTLSPEQKAKVGSLASGFYWLASPCVNCGTTDAHFGVRGVNSGSIGISGLFASGGLASYDYYGVRAVVYI